MRLKLGIWTAVAGVIFAALLPVARAVLKAAHLHWPAWVAALAVAVATLLAGAARPVFNVVTQIWAQRAKRGLDRQDRIRELERVVGGREKGLPTVGEITDRALLGIHPSIPLPSWADPSLAPDFPLYVPRDVDADLRAWVTAHSESGGLLVLAGHSASGKSRCAYELIRAELTDWPIFMPSTASQVTEYFATTPAPRRLVVWLNETQTFLGSGGLTVETIRHILTLPGPVILIGTLWPQTYDALTKEPGTGLGDASKDTREILTILAQRKDMMSGFSAAELERAGSLASRDPRIAQALREEASSNLTETLAAAPALISRWLNASDSYGAAVITAAVIARQCGHPEPLPAKILQPLAEKALTPAELSRVAPHWFESGLVWARIPVRGSAAPLTPYATAPGIVDGDQVSDVLVQHAIRDQPAPGRAITESTWLLLIEHASPQACRGIADAAYQQRNVYITECATRKAADVGDSDAMSTLGLLLTEQGKDAEAEQWFRKAAAAGHVNAMFSLGLLLREQGKDAEAEECVRKAAEAGDTGAMVNLGAMLGEYGKFREAEEWLRKAAAVGEMNAVFNLGILILRQGNDTGAEEWFRRAADADDISAMFNLGNILKRKGDNAEAQEWFRRAATAGHTDAMINLGGVLGEQGDSAGAEEWFRRAAESEDADAMANLGWLLAKQGSYAEAEEWLRKAANAEHTDAMANLGFLLMNQGDSAGAEEWFRRAVATGHTDAMANLGILLAKQGKDTEAETWLRKAATAEHRNAIRSLGLLLADQGNYAEAEQWFRKVADAGDPDSMSSLGAALGVQDKDTEAETWFRRATAAGNTDAMANLGVALAKQGKHAEAETWLRKAIDAGNKNAMFGLGLLFAAQGRDAEAEEWLRKATDAGHAPPN